MAPLSFSLAFGAVAAITFLGTRWLDKRILLIPALAAAFYLGVDDFITGLPSVVRSLDFAGGHWNWSGKILSLALSALVVVALKLSPSAVGLTFKQRSLKPAFAGLVLFVVWGTTIGLLFKPGVANTETLLFQATMPGLAEELVYRGVAPAILLGCLRQERADVGIPWALIVAMAIVFGVWHAFTAPGSSPRPSCSRHFQSLARCPRSRV